MCCSTSHYTKLRVSPNHFKNVPFQCISWVQSSLKHWIGGFSVHNLSIKPNLHCFDYVFDNFALQSPGRDSPGDDSSASIGTVESSSYSSGGVGGGGGHSAGGSSGSGHQSTLGPNSAGIHVYRNSTTSLDSGRASNNESTATMSTFTGG